MLYPGLVSVSFRNEKPETIIWHARQAGLKCIEWGSDIHVPVGNLAVAEAVKHMTVTEGLFSCSYGSYFKIGVDKVEDFQHILNTASRLEVSIVRIWGGQTPSTEIGDSQFNEMVAISREICDMARERDMVLSLECHIGTITDDFRSAIKFINAVDRKNLKMHWQPNQLKSESYNLEAARELLPFITNIHVFHWDNNNIRYPLIEGKEIWSKYIEIFKHDKNDHNMLLEFMHDGELSSLEETAKTLISWIS